MASNTTLIKKLQHAINDKGERVLYQTSQWYSEQQDRPVTIYTIKKAIWDVDKNRFTNIELFSSTSQIQIVLFLRDYWYEINNWEIPTDNQMWNNAKQQYQERSGNNGRNLRKNEK